MSETNAARTPVATSDARRPTDPEDCPPPAQLALAARPNPADPATLDEVDRTLLHTLLLNPKLCDESLGHAVGISGTAAKRRLHRLERLGVLRGCQAVVRTEDHQGNTEVFVAVAGAGPGADPAAGITVPEDDVRVVYHTTGRWNAVLRVSTKAGDAVDELRLSASPHTIGVARIRRTYVKVHRRANLRHTGLGC